MQPVGRAFDLIGFEQVVYGRQHEAAARRLRDLLGAVAQSHGLAGLLGCTPASCEADAQLVNRLASAISALFADPAFELSELGYFEILNWHRWLAAIFAASDFLHADHVLRLFDAHGDHRRGFRIQPSCLLKFCLLYGPESTIPLDLDALWTLSPPLAAGLAIALVSPRFLGSMAAHEKRELILPWLSRRLFELDSFAGLPENVLHDLYMHCSYAHASTRHAVKKPINRLIRLWLAERQQAGELCSTAVLPQSCDGKPVLLVVLEWFTCQHSIYRTHSRTIEAARERFHVIGMAHAGQVDAVTAEVFDRLELLPEGSVLEQLQAVQALAAAAGVAVLYLPSLGMSPLSLFLSNWRLVGLQVAGLGHPATTHAEAIDALVVEDDYVADPTCFSEPLWRLPPDGMPYRPTQAMQEVVLQPRPAGVQLRGVVQIAICAASMKLNPIFLSTCAEIARRSRVPTTFHLLVAGSHGLVHYTVQRVIRRHLGDRAHVYAQLPYAQYLQLIHHCDLFLNPFPFGNTNGVVDAVWAGRVGVCLQGREVFEAIDPALFRRMGWPEWLVARDREAYITAACRLIEEPALRCELSTRFSGPEVLRTTLFRGQPERFADLLLEQLQNRNCTLL